MNDPMVLAMLQELCVNTERIAACLEQLVIQKCGDGRKAPPPPPQETVKLIPIKY